MKKVLITGAARGLGRSLADHLRQKNVHVIGTARNITTSQYIEGIEFLQLDLTDTQSIDRLAESLTASHESLDGIIHNAGVAYLDPADVLDESEYRHTFEVNFFGPLHLTKRLLPLLKVRKKTHLIFISSIVSVDHWPHLGVYAASKAALEAIAFEWAVLLKKWNIFVTVVQPNPLPTDMQILRSKNMHVSPYAELTNRELQWERIDTTCELISKILNSSSPNFQYQTGPYSEKAIHDYLHKGAYQNALEKWRREISL